MSRSAQLVTDISTTLRHYLHAWNAPTADERAAALRQALTPEVIYIDPHAGERYGIDAVHAVIEQFRSKSDYLLEATGHLDVHHQLFRLPWRLGDLDRGVLSHGTLVGEFNAAGKILRLWGFLDGKQAGD
ncbi:MAG: nuclear transport factor 2 family protein [Cyanobacteria bacterium J06632_22]